MHRKGYQRYDDVEGVALRVIKGVVYTDAPGHNKIWDSSDYAMPPGVILLFYYFSL